MAKQCGTCGSSTPQHKPTPKAPPRSTGKTITNVRLGTSAFGTPKVKFSFGGRKGR